MTTDRAALEKAINLECDHEIDGCFAKIETAAFYVLRDAAMKHLATLPVPVEKKWGVCSGYGWVHFNHLADAIDAVRVEVMTGRAVTIEYRVQA